MNVRVHVLILNSKYKLFLHYTTRRLFIKNKIHKPQSLCFSFFLQLYLYASFGDTLKTLLTVLFLYQPNNWLAGERHHHLSYQLRASMATSAGNDPLHYAIYISMLAKVQKKETKVASVLLCSLHVCRARGKHIRRDTTCWNSYRYYSRKNGFLDSTRFLKLAAKKL